MTLKLLLGGLGCVAAAGGTAIAVALLVHRRVPVARRQANNDVAGLAFAIIGVLYSILLTFVTMSVWTAADNARDSGRQEARTVADLRRYADTLATADQTALLRQINGYVEIVAHREWPRMATGRPVGPDGNHALDRIWALVDSRDPTDQNDQTRQAEARSDLRDLQTARDGRLAATDSALPPVMWLALILGAVLTVVNAMMFGVQGSGEYLAIVGMLACMSALLLFAVYQMEYPYQRGESIPASVFLDVAANPAA